MEDLRGKVLLIVNTAARCGLTPQYEGLEALYEKDRDRGFEIPDFPRNQFAFQAPRDAEKIDSFRKLKYDTNFPRFAKIKANGSGADPLCVYMKEQKPGGSGWNFAKFPIDRKGNVVDRFAPTDKPKTLKKSDRNGACKVIYAAI